MKERHKNQRQQSSFSSSSEVLCGGGEKEAAEAGRHYVREQDVNSKAVVRRKQSTLWNQMRPRLFMRTNLLVSCLQTFVTTRLNVRLL